MSGYSVGNANLLRAEQKVDHRGWVHVSWGVAVRVAWPQFDQVHLGQILCGVFCTKGCKSTAYCTTNTKWWWRIKKEWEDLSPAEIGNMCLALPDQRGIFWQQPGKRISICSTVLTQSSKSNQIKSNCNQWKISKMKRNLKVTLSQRGKINKCKIS